MLFYLESSKNPLVLSTSILFLASTQCLAFYSEETNWIESKLSARKQQHEFAIGTELQYFDYKESRPSVSNFKSEERGVVPGIGFSYRFAPNSNRFSFMIQSSYSTSHVFYDGALQNGTPLQSESGLEIFQGQLAVGYHLINQKDHELSLFVGLHTREWKRQLDSLGNSPAGTYPEHYTRVSLPIGLQWRYALSDHFQVGLEPSIALPVSGHFEVTPPNGPTFWNSLRNGVSLRVQAPVTYWLRPDFGISLNVFYETLSFQESIIYQDSRISIIEPDSTTHHLGSQIRVHFKM